VLENVSNEVLSDMKIEFHRFPAEVVPVAALDRIENEDLSDPEQFAAGLFSANGERCTETGHDRNVSTLASPQRTDYLVGVDL